MAAPVAFLVVLAGTPLVARAQNDRSQVTSAQKGVEKDRARADQAFEKQQYGDALHLYLSIYRKSSSDFEINRRIGWIYLNVVKGQAKNSIPYLRSAHRLRPNDAGVTHDLAQATAWARLFEESIPLYRQWMKGAPPEVPGPYLEFARVLTWAKKDEEAIPYYQMYLARSPSDMDSRLEAAGAMSRQKKYSDALEQYNYVLRFRPGNAPARVGVAQVLAWTGHTAASLDQADKVVKANPNNLDAGIVRAYDLLWLGRREEARAAFHQLAARAPGNADVQEGLKILAKSEPAPQGTTAAAIPEKPSRPVELEAAEASEARGNFPEAISHYRKYLEQSPQDEDAKFRLARVLGWNKEYGASEEMLRDRMGKHPNDAETVLQLAAVLSWDLKYAESVEAYRQALALAPRSAPAHLELARVLFGAKDYHTAREEFRECLKLDPGLEEARAGEIRATIAAGDLDSAETELAALETNRVEDPQIPELREGLETRKLQKAQATSNAAVEAYYLSRISRRGGDLEARMALAQFYVNQNNFPAAIGQLQTVLKADPNFKDAPLVLARVSSWNRDYGQSESLYRQWLSGHPTDQAARLELARVLSWDHKYADSLALYQEVLTVDPSSPDARLERCRVLSWSRRYDEAANGFQQILKDDPKNYDALAGLARVYSYTNRWQQALDAYNSALAVKPQDADALTGKAQVLLWSGHPAESRKLLRQLQNRSPSDPTILVSLASAENSLQRRDRALNYLRAAEQADPKNPDVRALRGQIESELRPELRLGWAYTRDTEGLNIWRYQAVDFRFSLHPQVRNFLQLDYLPSSGPAPTFAYPLFTAGGTLYASGVPINPFVPSPTLLTAGQVPPQLLVPASSRLYQAAAQLQLGATIQANRWLSVTASAGAVQLRHGGPDLAQIGMPSTEVRAIYSVAPTIRIGGRAWFSFGRSRRYFAYTPKAISEKIFVEETSAGLALRINARTRIDLSGYRRDISPDFDVPPIGTFQGQIFHKYGYGGTAATTRTVLKGESVTVDLGYEGMAFGYRHPSGLAFAEYYVNPGFFTPSFYQRHAASTTFSWQARKWAKWVLVGTGGAQQIHQGSDFSPSATAGTRFEFSSSRHTTLTMGYDYFNTASALQALIIAARAKAYHSNSVNVSLSFH